MTTKVEEMIPALLDNYMKDRTKGVATLIQKCEQEEALLRKQDNGYLVPLVVGTHFVSEVPDDSKAIHYIRLALDWNPSSPVASYQLAYVLETRLRLAAEQKDSSKVDRKELNEMIRWYQHAARAGEGKAMNQLGRFCIDFEDQLTLSDLVPPLDKSTEEFLLESKRLKVPQAYNNLIRLYQKTDQYDKLISTYQEKLAQLKRVTGTRETQQYAHTLMELLLAMLNHGDYAGYCRFVKSYQGGRGTQDVSAFLKSASVLQKGECCVCLNVQSCFKLACNHICCNDCLFEIFAHETRKPICPGCTSSLQ